MLAVKPNVLHRVRAYHDIVTLPSKKAVVSSGPPGYSAVSGHTVTVFGCTGFLGRYVVSQTRLMEVIGKIGTNVITPYRDEDEARHLKLMGDLGQIVRMEWDIRDEKSIAECLRHSDTVINLNFDFKDVNALGSLQENGVSNFIQVSHLNAAEDSPSQFMRPRVKVRGASKEAFPTATIVRPSAMYGYEDKFLTNMAVWPIWWKLNNSDTKVRPVHVMDVAQALANLTRNPKVTGEINLPYLLELVESVTLRPPSRAPGLPKFMAQQIAKLGNTVWWPTLSPDEVTRRFIDDAEHAGNWDAVGIVPAEIEDHAITYLRRYRSAVNFVRPVVFPPRPQPAVR
ncbi:NADH dehydrogenase [Coprinopsis sp. MPI-PUGE-AT-0042]|nr:NADH dehydrogenase [Coprinopsis sp. MPI-PUGE-AT-0042]